MVQNSRYTFYRPLIFILLLGLAIFLHSCYSFKDVSIPPEVKTVRITYFENRARYINPQLSPQLTDKLRQKVNGQTRLTIIQGEDAHYDISGTITNYDLSTAGIANQQASSNRLNVVVHVVFINRLDEKKSFEADVTYSIDFDANLSLTQVEQSKGDEIARNLTDAIFNKIFSNW